MTKFCKIFVKLNLCKIWQNFDEIIDNKVPISQKFHEIFANVLCLVFFFCNHQFVLYRMTQKLSEVCGVFFLCFVKTSGIFSLLLTLSFINLPFSYTEKNAGKNRWWRNIICNETNISVSLVIIYFAIKSTIEREQWAVSFNTEYLLLSNPHY